MMRWLIAAAVLSAAGPIALAGNSDAEAGRKIFVEQCSLCHATTDATLYGPGLQGVTKKKELVSGKPPTAANLKQLISNGQGAMPRIPLDDAQLDPLVDYLKTL